MTLSRILRFSFFLIALCGAGRLYSQLPDYHVQLFDESDGVRTDVEHVVKDDLGFIWLTYTERVQRYDGKQIQEFVIGDRINSILTDHNYNVWVTSRSQVHLYENNKKSFRRIEVVDSDKLSIGSVIQLPGHGVCLLTSLGFYGLDQQRSKFIPIRDEKLILKTPVNTRRFSSSQFGNTIFYSRNDTLWSLDILSGLQRHLPIKSLLSVYALNESQVLVSTWKYQAFLFDLKAQTIRPLHPAKYLRPHLDDFIMINAIVNLDANRYLLATTKGIVEFDARSCQLSQKLLYHKGQPLMNVGRIVDLHMDQDHQVWACSENSLMVFDPVDEVIGLIRNSETDHFNGLNSQIRNFAADEKENLWLSTNNGIIYWDLQKNTQTSFFAVEGATDRMNHPSVRGIAFDGKHVIIGQTDRGVWLYDPISKKYRGPVYEAGTIGEKVKRKLESDFVDQLYRLHNGNYFIAARDRGYLLEAGSYRVREVDFPGSDENLNFSYEDQWKQVWIGTTKGIYCLDSNLVFKFSIRDSLGNGAKRSLLQWNDKEYILGAKGLYAFEVSGEVITTRVVSHFFDNINIHALYRDSADRLWLGTDQGLYRFTKASGMVESFDRFDNSQGDFFNGNSLYHRHDGMLFLGGTNGINYFHPDKIKTRRDSLKVSILKVTVNQDDTSYLNRAALLSLNPSQNYIEIEFVAPFYGNTNRVQYKYQLNGLDATWKNIGHDNIIRFNSLPPGKYHFNVAASLNGSEWHNGQESISFYIAFPFWQTWWFIVCCILGIGALIFYFVRRRIGAIRQKEKVKREYEKRIAEVEMHALRAQMNPHFMFNSLNSINNFILKNDPDNASGYLTKFSRLMRLILDNSRSEWVLLEDELKALELYIELEIVRFDNVFDYEIIVSPEIDVNTTSIPPMIIQPYVENAIWHGLLHRAEPGGKLTIRLWRENQQLHICVEDNGVGREEAKRMKSKSATRHKSHGMKITAERIEIVNRIYNVNATVQIEDLAGSNGHVGGTRVFLTLADKKYDSHYSG